MRAITGSGKLVREYIENLSNKDNVVIFPENGLDVNEQAEFISDLLSKNPEFSGDIITLSSFILSDIKDDNVFILNEDGGMRAPDFNTFGASNTKINFNIFQNKITIGNLAYKNILEFQEIVNSGNINNDTFHKIDSTLGESTEKFLLLKCLFDATKGK